MRLTLNKDSNLRFPGILGLSVEEHRALYSKLIKHVIYIIAGSFSEDYKKAEYAFNKFFEEIEEYEEREKMFMLLAFGDASNQIEDHYMTQVMEMVSVLNDFEDAEQWYNEMIDSFTIKSTVISKNDLFNIPN